MVVHVDPTKFNRTCPRCQANVHGTNTERCPECGGSMVPHCIRCGYDLAGLSRDHTCPECGTAVEQSYAPDLIENRSLEFLTSLHSGLKLVFFGIIAMICMTVLGILASILLALSSLGGMTALDLAISILNTVISLVILLGWWRITTPDPGRVSGGLDVRPRRIIRFTLCVQLAASALFLALEPFVNSNNLTTANPLDAVYMGVGLVSLIAWGVQFFAAMLYIRWLARRVPDYKLEADAKRFMWLGPVLYIPGSCILVGPLIALVMYLVMLNTLRRHVFNTLSRLGAI